jgi:hypothetical protein
LQAARREIKRARQLLQGQSRSPHKLLHHSRTKTAANRLAQVAIIGKGAPHGAFAPETSYYRKEFIDHIVAYYSDKWRARSKQ